MAGRARGDRTRGSHTRPTMTPRFSFRTRITALAVLGNLGGALLTSAYFNAIDPTALGGGGVGAGEALFFILAFAALVVIGLLLSQRWDVTGATRGGLPLPGPQGDPARRRILLAPALVALSSGAGWLAAGLIWGVLWPALTGEFGFERSLRQVFGISLVAGPTVTAFLYFAAERLLRAELPRLIPDGSLAALGVARLRVRTRLLAVFLLLGLMPLAVLAVAALTRADALRTADAAAAAAIVRNLNLVVVTLAAGGIAVSVGLAALVAASIALPLRDVQRAMSGVQRGELDTRCAVVSNDEIGAVAEGFNSMVHGLREREAIRETFGKYVSPEVRDEILAGRVSGAGATLDVTILFADLRDFTPWVESHPAAEVVADLNAYFAEMDAAIRAEGGLVLQFIGDEIEAVFGAPIAIAGHADAALAAARAMGERLNAFNAARRAQGKPALRHGIGIHSGSVIAGNIGSSERLSYALVGDAVNVASRIQALNKEFGTTVLVSAATQALLASSAHLSPLPAARVKGRASEVAIYALAGPWTDAPAPSMRST